MIEKKLRNLLAKELQPPVQVSHMIILAGTNDLGTKNASVIITNLSNIYNLAKSVNSKVIAVTIPESANVCFLIFISILEF